MSDNEKNPDFTLEIEDDEIELSLDNDEIELSLENEDIDSSIENEDIELNLADDIFEDFEKAEDDLLTEEELENLIIGMDEENDILDIPDEEEVLEELKFFDENFSVSEENEVKETKKIAEEKTEKSDKKEKNTKKEKAPKPPKPPRKPIDLRMLLLKNKLKIIIGILVLIIGSFVLTFFMVLSKKPKVEEFEVGTTTETAIIVEETPKTNNSEEFAIPDTEKEDKEIKSLKEELSLVTEEARKVALQEKILDLEEKKVEKIKEVKVENLKKYYDENLKNMSPSIVKSEDKIMVIAFVVQSDNFEEELYNAIEKTFEDKYDIDKISYSILQAGERFNKIAEITVDINKFKEVSNKNITIQEKLKLMGLQRR